MGGEDCGIARNTDEVVTCDAIGGVHQDRLAQIEVSVAALCATCNYGNVGSLK